MAVEKVQFPRAEPLPYQWAIVRYLKSEESDLWSWFCSTRRRDEQAEAVRLDLLKSTYRLESASHPELYGLAEDIRTRYGLCVPITFYQAQTGGGMNASLAYLPKEAHIILTGPVTRLLSQAEQQAMLAHELAHFLLYEQWEGEFLIATELLHALCNDAAAAPSHLETARLFRLYTEVFADCAAYGVTGDAAPVIATLIKLETGLSEVSAESYLRQAEEIFSKSRVQANQLTHPESYIRARALKLWAERGPQAASDIERMVEGPPALERLDLLGQTKIATSTGRMLRLLLTPPWFQTEPVLAHARLFFNDFRLQPNPADEPTLIDEIGASDAALQDYYCYVMLDFVTVDRDLGDAALAAALVLSRRLKLQSRFATIAVKELSLGKKQFGKIEREAEEVLAKTNEAARKA
ncbi:MAG: M48 family metalloprotease [Planctomycetes bacterium]|nr:M48 family metalloprotease [Planctomycetota bacterium]